MAPYLQRYTFTDSEKSEYKAEFDEKAECAIST